MQFFDLLLMIDYLSINHHNCNTMHLQQFASKFKRYDNNPNHGDFKKIYNTFQMLCKQNAIICKLNDFICLDEIGKSNILLLEL